jgi:hypothetical protein
MKYPQFVILTIGYGFLLMPVSVNALSIYYAADKPPSDNAPTEAPLCYQFEVASLEEQWSKLKTKYSILYDDKIVENPDGSRSLFAKRKDEQGNEVQYFYSSSPRICNEYQQKRLNLSAENAAPDSSRLPVSAHPPDIAKSVLDKVYSGYDKKQGCWWAVADKQRYCMKIDRTDHIATANADRLYALVAGVAVDDKGEPDINHVTLGLVGAFVIEVRQGRTEIVAGDPKIEIGSQSTAPTDWKFIKLGPDDYWGWQNTWGDCHQGYCGTRHALLAPQGKKVADLAGFVASFTDEGNCTEDQCHSTTIDSTLEIDTTQINDPVFPLLITITGTDEGKPLTPKTWTIPFNIKKWSYSEPNNWPLKDREF